MMCVEIAKEMSLDMGNAITDTTTFIIARAKTMGANSARKNLPESPRTRGFLFFGKNLLMRHTHAVSLSYPEMQPSANRLHPRNFRREKLPIIPSFDR